MEGFLTGKSEKTLALFSHLVNAFKEIGVTEVRATKSMIAIGDTRKVHVIRLGKNFVDVVFSLDEPHADNLCFSKIARVPNTIQYNHHLRILEESDINEEVVMYMKMTLKK